MYIFNVNDINIAKEMCKYIDRHKNKINLKSKRQVVNINKYNYYLMYEFKREY